MPTLNDILGTIAPIAGIAAPIVGGINATRAAGAATNALTQGGQQAINTIQQGANQAQSTLTNALQPFVQAGQSTLPSLTAGVQPGGQFNTPFNANTFNLYQDPGFQFRLQQGLKAVQAAQNASGLGYSGATLKALNDYAQGQASQAYQQAFQNYQTDIAGQFNRLMGVTGLGAQAAGTFGTSLAGLQTGAAQAIANIQGEIASAIAVGDYNKANALNSTLQAVTGSLGQTAALNQLGKILNPAGTAASSLGTMTPTNFSTLLPGQTGSAATTSFFDPTQATDPAALAAQQMLQQESQGLIPGSTAVAPASGSAPFYSMPVAGTLDTGVVPGTASDIVTNLPGSIGTIAGPVGTVFGTGTSMAAAGVPDLASIGAAAAGSPLAGTGVLATGDLAPGAAPAAGGLSGALSSVGSALGSGLGAVGSAIGTGASAIGSGLGTIASMAAPLLTNPITIGIGGALLAGGAIIKAMQVHPVANTFVQTFQNPFDKQAGNAFQSFVSGVTSGQMSQDQAIQAYQGLQQMYTQYQNAIQTFGQKGSKEKTVANQALQTFNQEYGPNGQNVLNAMAGYIANYFGPQAWALATGQSA